MNTQDLLKRTDGLMALGNAVLITQFPSGFKVNYVQTPPMTGFRSASLSFIQWLYGNNHPHFKMFTDRTANFFTRDAEEGLAILEAIREEISGGWLSTIKNLVASEFFADFITMAEHLLETNYKDPAAVVAGSVLEEHLRQLCIKNELDVEDERDGRMSPRKADRLNTDLAKSDVYNKLDQKSITAWLDLRNNAAHGKYEAYSNDQVKQMINGIIGFVARNPL